MPRPYQEKDQQQKSGFFGIKVITRENPEDEKVFTPNIFQIGIEKPENLIQPNDQKDVLGDAKLTDQNTEIFFSAFDLNIFGSVSKSPQLKHHIGERSPP